MSDVGDADLTLGRRGHRARPRRRPRGLAAVTALLGVVLVPVVLVLVIAPPLLHKVFGGPAPDYPGPGDGTAVVHVVEGASAAAIGQELLDKQVVRSARAFVEAADRDDRSRGIQPGYYQLRQRMSGAGALALLLDPKARLRSRVTIPEGTHLARALRLIAANTEVPLASLQEAAGNPRALGLPTYAGGSLEGFLFPATYDVEPGTSAVEVLTMMTERFQEAAASVGLEEGAGAVHLTPKQVVTIASIIERESAGPDDRAKVARVFYNRLAQGMQLGSEATVRFALGYPTKDELTQSDIHVQSPYNTYQVKGVPPGPICSPGEEALQAALHPAAGSWLYFFTRKDGRTVFSNTAAEFDASQRGNG